MTPSCRHLVLLLPAVMAFASCVRKPSAKAPSATSSSSKIEIADAESIPFDDFLAAMALLSRNEEIPFQHPKLASPIHFELYPAMARGEVDPIDPVGLVVTEDEILYGEDAIRAIELQERLTEYRRLAEAAGDEPRVFLRAKKNTPFAAGVLVLMALAESGFAKVYVLDANSRPPLPIRSLD